MFNYDEHVVVSSIPWHEKSQRAMHTRSMSVNWSFLSRREIKFRSEADYLEEPCSVWSDCHHTAIIYLREEGIMERKIPTVQATSRGWECRQQECSVSLDHLPNPLKIMTLAWRRIHKTILCFLVIFCRTMDASSVTEFIEKPGQNC